MVKPQLISNLINYYMQTILKTLIKSQATDQFIQLPFHIPKLGLTMDILKPSQYHQAATISSSIFSLEEPLTSYLQIPPQEIYGLALETLQSPQNSDISIAITNQNSDIVASLICEHVQIGVFQKELDPPSFTPSIYKIMKLLQKTRTFYDNYYHEQTLKGEVMDFFMGTVSKKWRGKGLRTFLSFGASIAGLSKGYSRAIGENTNLFSQIAAKNSGFKVLTSIDYSIFKINNDIVFDHVDEVYTKAINRENPKKQYIHTAQKCNLVDASLNEVYRSTLNYLGITN